MFYNIYIGWGTQFFGGPSSDILMEVVVPVWTQERCRQAFAQRVTNSVICAGSSEGGRDACQVYIYNGCCFIGINNLDNL